MELKKVCAKALGVFTAAFVLPMSIWYYSVNAEKLKGVAKASAVLTMGKKVSSAESRAEVNQRAPVGSSYLSRQTVWDINMAREEKETHSESKEIPTPKPSEEVLDALPYPESLENNDGPIIEYTYERYTDKQYFDLDNGGQVRNCTDISNSELYTASGEGMPFELDKNSDEPQILIYHTHTTESFEPYERDHYDASFSCKSTDTSMNIVSVGNKICEQLDEAGIAYVHDTLVHDYPSYDDAYDSSRLTVQEILEKYPSIKICLDIHRDGIEREDGTRLSPIVEVNGKKAAQIMIISGCDDGTLGMPNYMENFKFACNLQSSLESDWQEFTRPILFDYRFYNQDLTTGSLLIEVGSHGNSIDQVQYSGELIGKTLAKMFE